MNDVYKLTEKTLALILPFVLVYIITSYTGYELYFLTKKLISPQMLPSTVFYWITAKCCLLGFSLTVVNVLAFIALFFNLERMFEANEYRKTPYRNLLYLLGFPAIKNSNRYLFTKLQNYLFTDLDEEEKILLLKLRLFDLNNEYLYNKVLEKQIIYANEISKISNFINNQSNYKAYSLSKKDKKILKAITKKLGFMMELKLTTDNINRIMKCYTKEYCKFYDLIILIVNNQHIDSHRKKIYSFIGDETIYNIIATPIEKGLKKFNNFPVLVETISAFSWYALIIAIFIFMYLFYKNDTRLVYLLIIGEVIFLTIFSYFGSSYKSNKEDKTELYIITLVTLVICITVSIITVTPYIIKMELNNNKWFVVISEVNNDQHTELFVDKNITNQLVLEKYEMIDDCTRNASVFCYINTEESSRYLQLRNFKYLYMLNLNESSKAYLIDVNDRMFNLSTYGNHYVLPVKNTSNNKVENPKNIMKNVNYVQ